MKITRLILVAGVFITFNACNQDLENMMTSEDVAALEAMEIAYLTSIEYNDSLASYIERTGINDDETCFYFDGKFHENDSLFEASHLIYSHNNGEDHDGNSWMMGSGWSNSGGNMGNGVMGNHGNGDGFNSGICNSNNLDLMDSLMEVHLDFHPGN